MNQTVVVALIGAIGVIASALIGAYIQSRRVPSDARLADAQAEKTQHEASGIVIANLVTEVNRLKVEVEGLKKRLTRAEIEASNASEFRRATIVLGEKLDLERGKVFKLAEIIGSILECIDESGKANGLNRQDVTRLVASIVQGA